ncbi:DUF2917 domain-containing protein [Geomonas terrae]|uniref:DUF2917 domain-containing protein n=1 Tax=Geomonas terrae TaxID=2562681 RepID=A0A4S1CH62_9BACT|nr:DUF2917 domain-containing protein [Geomonas terrae]TGU70525.1 DUF2917 domain-containing protein [Geomonas terrae]TGU72945.1 DUF2917 domain-containing protein [Geomonas terrae]
MRCELQKGELLTLQPGDGIASITLTAGKLWLTRTNDTRDYCLSAGARLEVRSGETLFLEALAPCAVLFQSLHSRSALRVVPPCPIFRPA